MCLGSVGEGGVARDEGRGRKLSIMYSLMDLLLRDDPQRPKHSAEAQSLSWHITYVGS